METFLEKININIINAKARDDLAGGLLILFVILHSAIKVELMTSKWIFTDQTSIFFQNTQIKYFSC